MRKIGRKWLVIWPGFIVLACCVGGLAFAFLPSAEEPYSDPPTTMQESDLTGVWESRYGSGLPGKESLTGIDKLIIRDDGTFKQIYSDSLTEGYVYETPWNELRFERFPDGRIWLHLAGARYYAAGTGWAERNGPQGATRWFYRDPFGNQSTEMDGELILMVRRTSAGDLVLLHMLANADEGLIKLLPDRRATGFRRSQ